jgi:predicted nucleic acid-binding Zn ribbon protein
MPQLRSNPQRKQSMSNIPASITCPHCGDEFPFRSNKKFCSPSCRKLSAQRDQRKKQPVNATNSPDEKRKQHEVFELAARMAETLYSMPPFQRLGYIEEVVQLARSGNCPRVRQILTMPALIRPNPDKKHLFPRGCRSYCTISQAADRYCLISPWNSGVAAVVRGKVSEPPTGEINEVMALAA